MREIEIKLRVKNFNELEQKLKERGCVLSEPISQHDTIYTLEGDSSNVAEAREGGVVIRIRQMKDQAQINLKKQKTDGMMDSLEYESEVRDPVAMDQILRNIGWVPFVEVKKLRRKGKLGEYQICLDEVEQLGSFMELEALTRDEVDVSEVRESLFKELESLGLSRNDEVKKHYDTQIYELGKN